MNQSEFINELAAALSKAQGAFPLLEKNKRVTVRSKTSGAEYSYYYAELGTILEATKFPLMENGLSITFQVGNPESPYLTAKLFHSSGQWVSTQFPLIIKVDEKVNAMQAFGSAVSYAKRYAISCLLNLASDDDDDAGSCERGAVEKQDRSIPPANMSDTLTAEELEQLAWRHKNHPEIIGSYLSRYGVELAKDLPRSCYSQLLKDYTREYMKSKGQQNHVGSSDKMANKGDSK